MDTRKTIDVNYFNDITWIKIWADDNFTTVVEKLDKEDIRYFYISMNKQDVLDAVQAEKEIAESLWLRYFYIKELWIYIATY